MAETGNDKGSGSRFDANELKSGGFIMQRQAKKLENYRKYQKEIVDLSSFSLMPVINAT